MLNNQLSQDFKRIRSIKILVFFCSFYFFFDSKNVSIVKKKGAGKLVIVNTIISVSERVSKKCVPVSTSMRERVSIIISTNVSTLASVRTRISIGVHV